MSSLSFYWLNTYPTCPCHVLLLVPCLEHMPCDWSHICATCYWSNLLYVPWYRSHTCPTYPTILVPCLYHMWTHACHWCRTCTTCIATCLIAVSHVLLLHWSHTCLTCPATGTGRKSAPHVLVVHRDKSMENLPRAADEWTCLQNKKDAKFGTFS